MDAALSPEAVLDARGATEHYGPKRRRNGAGVAEDLCRELSIASWARRAIPEPDRLLGDLLTTTSRMFVVGRTGLGKTMFGFGLACGIASGRGFLHWRSTRAARVLYCDGEMPAELIKARSIDALSRSGVIPDGNLTIFARDSEEDFARRYPAIGAFAPLNTAEGQAFILALVEALGGVDAIVFDNVMSLVAGDQREEVPWSETLPLVAKLTSKRIGQVWLDHTGHNSDRQYGSATKAWRFDAVGLMTPLSEDEPDTREIAFQLSFEPPGKARRRTPANWGDFQTCTVRLRDNAWSSDAMGRGQTPRRKLNPTQEAFYRALLDALAVTETLGSVTREAWFAECSRQALVAQVSPDDSHPARERKRGLFRKQMHALKVAGWIGVDGETVRALIA